jgi:hypothetical protein
MKEQQKLTLSDQSKKIVSVKVLVPLATQETRLGQEIIHCEF